MSLTTPNQEGIMTPQGQATKEIFQGGRQALAVPISIGGCPSPQAPYPADFLSLQPGSG